jgi:hypothetical protein
MKSRGEDWRRIAPDTDISPDHLRLKAEADDVLQQVAGLFYLIRNTIPKDKLMKTSVYGLLEKNAGQVFIDWYGEKVSLNKTLADIRMLFLRLRTFASQKLGIPESELDPVKLRLNYEILKAEEKSRNLGQHPAQTDQ